MPASSHLQQSVMEAVERYEMPLLRYARRLLGDLDLARDAVQHAFVQLCSESSNRLEERIAPWLFRVCRNRALDHLRRGGREQLLLDITADSAVEQTLAEPDSREVDPAQAIEHRDLADRLRELMQKLPAPQRETIDLWCEGLNYRQIAEIVGREEGHVRVLAHRGFASLRKHPLIRGLLSDDVSQSETIHSFPAR
ncbi:MAG: RNA polymerase sigma factor [Planctomycetia bacterium]|jgi:RNA polymerase sigma factor (sigma-70 family)|nr:RNA polymerase sigma factor [Planctomycetia bacterium]